MTEIYLATRVLHVVLGAFWMGAIVFAAFYLMPAVAEAGPDGAKVMAGIVRRKYLNVVPIVALVNIVSGFWLYWRFTGGFDPGLSGTPGAMVFGTGGILAVVALHIGLLGMRRNILKAGALTAKASALPDGAERAALMAEANARRKRAFRAGPIVAIILILTTALMALGHYV
jgi:uncharacterized membrane protein